MSDDNSRDEWDAMAEVTRRPLPGPTEHDEATALRAEVERLRGDLDALSRAVGQAVVASSLAAGETLADPIPHIIVATVTRLRAEALGQRAEASYLRACVPPTHPADYGHEVWTEAVRTAVEAERAAVVAWLGNRAEEIVRDCCSGRVSDATDAIERGEHRREETQMTTERSCYTCRHARGFVCDHPCRSEEMEMAIDAYAIAAGCHMNNGGMPLDRTINCPGHENGEHRREETE